MMRVHQKSTPRDLIRVHLNQKYAEEVGIMHTHVMADGILIIYVTGESSTLSSCERVAFFTTGGVDNRPAVKCEWDNACEPQ